MDAAYWIWLQMGLGIASPAAQQVLGHRIDPRTLYRMSLEQMVQQEIFSAAVCARLRSVSLSTAQRIARNCMHKGYQIIALTDSAYPRQLYGLPDPPLVLYAQGNTALLNQLDELPGFDGSGDPQRQRIRKKSGTQLFIRPCQGRLCDSQRIGAGNRQLRLGRSAGSGRKDGHRAAYRLGLYQPGTK